jgi:hypothetical protein
MSVLTIALLSSVFILLIRVICALEVEEESGWGPALCFSQFFILVA